MRSFGSLFAKPGLGEPGGLYDAREACLINEIDLKKKVEASAVVNPRPHKLDYLTLFLYR
jgi:hypothetical protein